MTESNKEALIVIPAYNEAENLPAVLGALREGRVTDFADILVVDDASRDDTAATARKNGARCVTFPYNLGYGNALRAGYQYATRKDYRYVIQMDADGQHDTSAIPALYEALRGEEKPDIVLGSRFLPESAPYAVSAVRGFGMAWYRLLLRRLTGERIADPTTGLQGLSRRTFSYYARFDHFDARYPDANMLVQMLMLGYSVKQIPVVMHSRMTGEGMHAGVYKPIAYMFRSTLSVFALWLCLRSEKGRKHFPKH